MVRKASKSKSSVHGATRRRLTTARARREKAAAGYAQYVCDSCGYVYDTSDHHGIIPEDQLEGWGCPQCAAESDHFQIRVPSDKLDESRDDDDDDIDVSDKLVSGRRLASIKSTNPDVDALAKRWRRGDLDLQPKFQRYDVWTDKIRSALIESILLELPIPTIYLAEGSTGKFVVVDGQQRLTAIFRFLENEYSLKGLKALKRFNTQRFRDLPKSLQRRIEDRALDVTEIYKETDANVKFSLFERLNRGSVKLNDQELRNCIYRGKYNDFVVKLADNPILKTALRIPKEKRHSRMVDAELSLRFLAFYQQTYLRHPDKKTGEFLNRQMELGKGLGPQVLKRQERAFNDALQSAQQVYGDRMFHRFKAGNETDPNGDWEPRINRALMDVVLYTFTQYKKGDIANHSNAIREATVELMATEEFADLISHTISSAERVKRRFQLFDASVARILDSTKRDPRRSFSASTKRELFKTNSTCTLCENEIMVLDDAHVDHRKPHSAGGRTTLSNAGLTHRFCNQSAGAKKPEKSAARRSAVTDGRSTKARVSNKANRRRTTKTRS